MLGKLAILIIFPALLLYSLYTPLPDDIKDRWTIQWTLASFKAIQSVCTIIGKLRLHSEINCTRMGFRFMPAPPTPESNIKVVRTSINGVEVIITIPDKVPKPYSAFVFIHGGGFVYSNAEAYLHTTAELTEKLQVAVFSINYRLAPEYPFPVPFEDCVAVTSYLLQNADKYDVNPSKISVIGDSAGGNLAAAVALKLRDQKSLPSLKSQILIYPVLQAFDFLLPSYQQNQNILLTSELMGFFTLLYINEDLSLIPALIVNNHTSPELKKSKFATYLDTKFLPSKFREVNFVKPKNNFGSIAISSQLKDKILNPFAFPLMADDLKGLPPALILVCHYDPLRDEGILYAHRLKEAKVDVQLHIVEGGIHGSFSFSKIAEMGVESMNAVVNYAKKMV